METAATRVRGHCAEEEDDEDREERAQQSLSHDVADGIGDRNGLVEDGLELDAVTDGVADVGERCLDLVDHRDSVGVGALITLRRRWDCRWCV